MRNIVGLLLVWMMLACGGPTPNWEGIDWNTWRNDRDACGQQRAKLVPALDRQKEKLKSMSEMEVVKLMGKPDENELYKRNQKFFYYYLSPGPGCPTPDSAAQRLVIRFNAMGLAKEVSIE
jgi:hypothetical protein